MPGTLLITVVSWLASHLIILTLLAFAVVGFMLYDKGEQNELAGEGPPPTADKHRSTDSDTAVTVQPGQAPVAALPKGRPADLASEPERKPAKQPKLIGGSLPVYQRMPGEPEKGSFDASGGFRPPEPVSAPPVVDANDYEARLQAARRAFWNGEFELAEAGYVELITIHPDDADAFGELGNLYETMGEWQLAKDAYFAAGERLKQAGEIEKLNHVIDLLEGKGDARAQRLRQP